MVREQRAWWKRLQAEFYTTVDGRCPFLEWVRSQPYGIRKAIGREISVLESGVENFRRVDVRHLSDTGGLYELRTKVARLGLRSLFFFWESRALVFVHGFEKKSRKTPARHLHVARERMLDHKRRYGNDEDGKADDV